MAQSPAAWPSNMHNFGPESPPKPLSRPVSRPATAAGGYDLSSAIIRQPHHWRGAGGLVSRPQTAPPGSSPRASPRPGSASPSLSLGQMGDLRSFCGVKSPKFGGNWPIVPHHRTVYSGMAADMFPTGGSLPSVSRPNSAASPRSPASSAAYPPSPLRRPGTASKGHRTGKWQHYDRRNLKALEVGAKKPFNSWINPDVVFDQIDKDGSGSIDVAEAIGFFRGKLDAGKVESMFAALDTDRSGCISKEEWRKGYYNAGFGAGTIVGQSSEGLNVLLGLINKPHHVDFQDLTHHRPPVRIRDEAARGITLAQLREMWAHVVTRVGPEGWVGVEGQRLTATTVTMYDLLRYVIKPATHKGQCSYIEAIALDAQPPLWCVSHWWGTPIRDMLDCLEQHSSDRGVPEHAPYWISAFAINQHGFEKGFAEQVPLLYDRALKTATGTIAVIDKKGTALKRTWVLYEMHRSLADVSLKLDLYTSYHHVCVTENRVEGTRHRECIAVGFCEGFNPCDLKNYYVNKFRREAFFPLHLAINALAVTLQGAHASVEEDRRALLYQIAGGTRHIEPPEKERAIEVCNANLRAHFASSALRSALEYNDDLYEQCLAVIKKSSIKKMMLSFPLCSKFSVENACMLADALPISIESFDFGFDNVDKQAGEIFVKALARRLMETRYALPSKKFGGPLKYLGLKSNRITNEAATQIGNALSALTMPNLQVLDFGFPVPFGFEAALAITECAFQEKDVLPRPLNFYGPSRLSAFVNVSNNNLTSADLILIVAAACTKSFGPLVALDVSYNNIDNNGLAALEKALKSGPGGLNKLPELRTIDLSHNKAMTQPMRMSILAARKGIRTPGAFDPAAPRYELAQKHDFRIIDGNAGYEEEEEKRKRREKEKADKIAAGGPPSRSPSKIKL